MLGVTVEFWETAATYRLMDAQPLGTGWAVGRARRRKHPSPLTLSLLGRGVQPLFSWDRERGWLRVTTMTVSCGNIAPHSATQIVASSPRGPCLTSTAAPSLKGVRTDDEWMPPSGWPFVGCGVQNRISSLPPHDLSSPLTSLSFLLTLADIL